MCGIIGAIASAHPAPPTSATEAQADTGRGRADIVPVLIDGLKRLEYRGYDSSGIAVLQATGAAIETTATPADARMPHTIARVRRVGRVAAMEQAAVEMQIAGEVGIGHTRWATHGHVDEVNAHPHLSEGQGWSVALVHNGIIENHESERRALQALGYVFQSQTDSEVIAHRIHERLRACGDLFQSVRETVRHLQGAYAIAVVCLQQPDKLVGARAGCPLLLGIGNGMHLIASDVSALLSSTRRIVYLEEGDIACLGTDAMQIVNVEGHTVQRTEQLSSLSLASLELGPYDHYMQKEIHEQPRALTDTLSQVMEAGFDPTLFLCNALGQIPAGRSEAEVKTRFAQTEAVQLLACGTSFYAASVARYWIEDIVGLPCAVELASEYRYRTSAARPHTLVVTLSQSGETLDTLEALRHAQGQGHNETLSLCNVRESAIPRASRFTCYTHAGMEVGVASTKAFTTQLALLFVLTATLAYARKRLSTQQAMHYLEALRQLPGHVQQALNLEPQIRTWAERFADKQHALYLGRGVHYPIAMEGALKLKEISYIHAEAYAAGELKHGPLALVDEAMPVVVIAPRDALLEKLKANMQEVRARGGALFVFADLDSHIEASPGVEIIRTPRHVGVLSPIVQTIPVQLLAYHTARARGTDVDKPRNLAKAVTVE